MKRSLTVAAAGAATLATVALFAGPASAGRARPVAKATPKISIKLTPHRSVHVDGTLDAAVHITGTRGVVSGEIDILGMNPGDCNAQDLYHGRGGCEADGLSYPAGRHKVTVLYHGNRVYRATRASVFITITRAAISLSLDSAPERTGTAGKRVTFTAEAYDDAGPVSSGRVRFTTTGTRSGVIPGCGSVKIKAGYGLASCRTTLPTGSYTVHAAYSDARDYKPSSAKERYTVRPDVPTVATTTLPDGYVGSAYSRTLKASGGTKPYSWKIVAGGLPDGLSLSSAGVISGTPSKTGKWHVTPQVTDAAGRTASTPLTLRITTQLDTDLAMRCPGATFDTTTTCTLTATNQKSGPAPTGSLQYSDGRSFTGGCDLPAKPAAGASKASCTVSVTWDSEGTFTPGLTYFGDEAHVSEQGSASIPVAAQTGGLDTSAAATCPGAEPMKDVTCTITITNSPSSKSPAPSGTVDFSYLNDEGEVTGTSCTLHAGSSPHHSSCSFDWSFDDTPPDTVAINYHGDAKHHASPYSVPLAT